MKKAKVSHCDAKDEKEPSSSLLFALSSCLFVIAMGQFGRNTQKRKNMDKRTERRRMRLVHSFFLSCFPQLS